MPPPKKKRPSSARGSNRDNSRSSGSSRNDDHGIKNPYVRFHKLEKPRLSMQKSTLWDYPSQHYGTMPQGSPGYRGATPSYVIWNVLKRYTKEGDTILDPFCGSGTTLDVCKDLRRHGFGFDIAPHRDDIRAADARSLPLKANSVDHVFLDPPYADNLKYSDDPDCIGKTNAEDGSWQSAMEDTFAEIQRVIRADGIIAVLVSDVMHRKWGFQPLGLEVVHLGQKRWALLDHVIVTRHGKKVGDKIERGSGYSGGNMQRGYSHLLLFRAAAGKTVRRSLGRTMKKTPRERASSESGDRTPRSYGSRRSSADKEGASGSYKGKRSASKKTQTRSDGRGASKKKAPARGDGRGPSKKTPARGGKSGPSRTKPSQGEDGRKRGRPSGPPKSKRGPKSPKSR
jgi:adenine-specific DNA-methyltransferase